ncbi:MAG: aminomethyl-transferring glycine dehydrogenase subunit GcvPB [Candidatus Kapaibacterium sp.]|jgi:glycine dehydrogenase subunit 2|nr:aminomethyl-transferring glycine dehydrogenase subunit GcvPB [Candidatus Kapabacteria bacterium]
MEKLIFEKSSPGRTGYSLPKLAVDMKDSLIPDKFRRKKDAELPEVSENEVARHFLRLSHLNYNIEQGLYPLGSCTMKYNPKVNELTSSFSGFADLHPHSTDEMAQGSLQVMFELGEALKEVTGLKGVSLQPAAGSQGELTGILMFRAYHLAKGNTKRNKILIPNAAHGTNPASAAIAGFQIVELASNEQGRVDIEDLKSKLGDDTAGFMLTNPNTVGIFEKEILTINELVKSSGGLSYMDGANLNALLGIARPGDMGFDCVHINLHKTFSTPHGGGGPGAGPICVSDRLVPFLPVPQIEKNGDKFIMNYDKSESIGKMHAFFGNFGMYTRALTYIRMHGAEGLRQISENAILNANYIRALLKDNYKMPYSEYGMHEFVISADYQKELGVSAKDIAKRLLDYGFHAPTIYFPLIVHECMLIEPTETEAIENLEQFAEVMNIIAEEARTNPELVTSAPLNTPIKRVDDALAARKLNIRWRPE